MRNWIVNLVYAIILSCTAVAIVSDDSLANLVNRLLFPPIRR